MKPATLLVSLVAALAPFASACNDARPVVNAPAESIMISGAEVDSSTLTAPLSETKIKAPPGDYLYAREDNLFGKSYEDWARTWWQWALAIPAAENPMLGGDCQVNQSGKVFFLAGTTGGSDARSCAIPKNKAIFLPIVNLVVSSCPEYANASYTCDMALSEDHLNESADSTIEDNDIAMSLEIDGVSIGGLDAYRAHADTFNDPSPDAWDDRVFPYCTGPIRDNECGVPVGSTRKAVGDGFWVMLRPLPVGEHQIHFAATVTFASGGAFSLDVAYTINVMLRIQN